MGGDVEGQLLRWSNVGKPARSLYLHIHGCREDRDHRRPGPNASLRRIKSDLMFLESWSTTA
jgi:hypothetical protein